MEIIFIFYYKTNNTVKRRRINSVVVKYSSSKNTTRSVISMRENLNGGATMNIEYLDYRNMKDFYTISELCEMFGKSKIELKKLSKMLRACLKNQELCSKATKWQ